MLIEDKHSKELKLREAAIRIRKANINKTQMYFTPERDLEEEAAKMTPETTQRASTALRNMRFKKGLKPAFTKKQILKIHKDEDDEVILAMQGRSKKMLKDQKQHNNSKEQLL